MKRALVPLAVLLSSCSAPGVGPDASQPLAELGVAPAGGYYGLMVLDDPGLWIAVGGDATGTASRGIWNVQKDGSGRRLIVPVRDTSVDVHFAVDATYLYYVLDGCEVFRVEKAGGTPVSLGKSSIAGSSAKGLLVTPEYVLVAAGPVAGTTSLAPRGSDGIRNEANRLLRFPIAGGAPTELGVGGSSFSCDGSRACMTVVDAEVVVVASGGERLVRAVAIDGSGVRTWGLAPSLNTLGGLAGHAPGVLIAVTDRAPSLRCVVAQVSPDGTVKTLFDGPYSCGDPRVDATHLYVGLGTDEGGVGVLRQPIEGGAGQVLPLGRSDFMPRFLGIGPAAMFAAGSTHLVRVSVSAFPP